MTALLASARPGRRERKAPLKVCCAVLFLAMGSLAYAQTTRAAPPLRMGLWQTEVTVEVSGLSGSTDAPSTIVKRHCMQAESWKETMQKMQNQNPSDGCTTSNLQQDEHHLSFDQSCQAKDGLTTIAHVELHLDNKEAMHGTMSMNMTAPGLSQSMSSKSSFRSKFVSADCGSLKPDEQRDAPPS